MRKFIFYISGHGYGHAARQQAIIRELVKRGADVHVCSAAPQKFFREVTTYRQRASDAGMVQPYSLQVDPAATLVQCEQFLSQQSAFIAAELNYIQQHKIDVVVADMSPVAFEIGEVGNLPSVLITHFTWDFVYGQYVNNYPGYEKIIQELQASYKKAGLVLKMPFAHDFSLFSRVEDLSLVINPITQSRQTVRNLFHIPDDSPMILLSMGGHQWGKSNLDGLRQMRDKTFLVQSGAWENVKHLDHCREIPMRYQDYHNLLAAADLVIGKAGGSTVSEVIGHRTPMIYTLNDNWSENVLLQSAMEQYGYGCYLPRPDFERGDWLHEIDVLLDDQDHHWRPIANDGAVQAAERLLSLF